MKRPYGTGHIYGKSGAYYGRWHTPDGRRRNRRLGPRRAPRLQLERRLAERQARAGTIPHIRLGRYCRFRAEAIEAWIVELETSNIGAGSARNTSTRRRAAAWRLQ
jgi:hypothetical protein